ncbi:MAG: tRNA lysidine(34) synthetase TilS, partial [Bacteroidales bacterium]|nr:tRNA lysidine(34) synthetase TilS [Bacteroidales bacterium]
MMLLSFKEYIKKNHLASSNTTLIGVSGGRDSVVLCELYHQANLPFAIAHCNFNLRADESDADETFVQELAVRYNVQLHKKSCFTKDYAAEKGISIQMAARDLRFDFFKELLKKHEYAYYATAHHQDDAIETYLINQIRGTGIAGLHGILPKVGSLIHPLLFATREDIDGFIEKYKIRYKEDSSNASTKYLRNKIRHDLMPLFKEINPHIRDVFKDNMTRLNTVEQIYNARINDIKKEMLTDVDGLIRIKLNFDSDMAPTILYEMIKHYGFNFSQASQVWDSLSKDGSGSVFYSNSHRMLLDRRVLTIEKIKEKNNRVYYVDEGVQNIKSPLELNFEKSNQTDIIKEKGIAQFDCSKLSFPLVIRKWKRGDYFYPLGMKGRKKLISDFFIDEKVSLFEKEAT